VKLKLTQPYPSVIHFDFERIWHMAVHLGRIQEHAEHPKFRKQIFSRSRMKKYYHGQGTQYNKSALGYNIPSWAFEPFWDGQFTLTKHEKIALQALKDLGYGPGDTFYVLATADGSALTETDCALDHELCHAFYYIDLSYRSRVDELLKEYPRAVAQVRYAISQWGIYAPEVLDDEVHAYLATDPPSRLQERLRLDKEDLGAQKPFADLLANYKTLAI
jgi:hypothetical protein